MTNKSIYGLTSLTDENFLKGTIPSAIGGLTELTSLSLGKCAFSNCVGRNVIA
jgi:hypothetical protein